MPDTKRAQRFQTFFKCWIFATMVQEHHEHQQPTSEPFISVGMFEEKMADTQTAFNPFVVFDNCFQNWNTLTKDFFVLRRERVNFKVAKGTNLPRSWIWTALLQCRAGTGSVSSLKPEPENMSITWSHLGLRFNEAFPKLYFILISHLKNKPEKPETRTSTVGLTFHFWTYKAWDHPISDYRAVSMHK